MLDVLVANQDRHHENWGALRDDNALRLAPTFDHGSSMARNLSDDERQKRLRTHDHNFSIPAFSARARSALYSNVDDPRPLNTMDAFLQFAQIAPTGSKAWISRLHELTRGHIEDVLTELPVERMTPVCRDFTLELLCCNRQRLLEAPLS